MTLLGSSFARAMSYSEGHLFVGRQSKKSGIIYW